MIDDGTADETAGSPAPTAWTRGSGMRCGHTGVWLYVPATFKADTVSALRGLEDEANWFVHKVITTAIRHKHDRAYDGMAHISRKTMEEFVAARHVTRLRAALIDNGVVICDESYRISEGGVAGYSQSYGLAPAHAGELRRVEVTKPALANRIVAHRIRLGHRAVTETELDATLSYINGWLRRTHIDVEAAFEVISSQPDKPVAVVSRKVGKRGRRRVVKIATPDAKTLNRMVVETIAHREWEWSVCPYGRVHTNVTRLHSDCRACLSIDGSHLASVDVRNSQLVFFLLLLVESRAAEAAKAAETPESRFGPGGAAPTHTPRTDSLDHRIEGLRADEIEFKKRVLDGTVYDDLMKHAGYTDRRKFKSDFFLAVLYGDNGAYYSRHHPITRVFRHRYPCVWQFILDSKEGGYERLAQQMQVRESRFVIGRVCGRLAQYHPNVPCLTIHDSILTTPAHMPLVERVIREEFARIGVSPSLKVEWPVTTAREPAARTATAAAAATTTAAA